MKIKKIFIVCALLFITSLSVVNASTKVDASLYKCVDGDTAWFTVENENIKARFLAINTPESTTKVEKYGKEASKFTCDILTNSKKIVLEYDDNSNKFDKYNRHLVWVWVDGELLQEVLLKNSFAEVKYLYGDYDYIDHLLEVEETAKKKKLNIWEDKTDSDIDDYIYFGLGIIFILILLFSKKGRKKIKNKLKKTIKRKNA